MKLEIDQKTAASITQLAALKGIPPEHVVASAIEDQHAKFDALKNHIDSAYQNDEFYSDNEVANHLDNSWD